MASAKCTPEDRGRCGMLARRYPQTPKLQESQQLKCECLLHFRCLKSFLCLYHTTRILQTHYCLTIGVRCARQGLTARARESASSDCFTHNTGHCKVRQVQNNAFQLDAPQARQSNGACQQVWLCLSQFKCLQLFCLNSEAASLCEQ